MTITIPNPSTSLFFPFLPISSLRVPSCPSWAILFSFGVARHVPARHRLHRHRHRRNPRSASATTSSAGPPSTSPTPPRSSRPSASSAWSARTAPKSLFDVFEGRDVDTGGLEVRKGSKTFRWHGSYVKDMNEAVTVEVDLNVLAERAPKIPDNFLDSQYVFLANTHPALQQEMLASLQVAQAGRRRHDEPVDPDRAAGAGEAAEQDPRPGAQRRRSPPADRRRRT